MFCVTRILRMICFRIKENMVYFSYTKLYFYLPVVNRRTFILFHTTFSCAMQWISNWFANVAKDGLDI